MGQNPGDGELTGTPGEPLGGSPGRARYLGLGPLALALLMWALVPVFLPPLPAGQKGRTTAALLVVGEAALWVSAVPLGREVVRRYRSYLDPHRLFRREGP